MLLLEASQGSQPPPTPAPTSQARRSSLLLQMRVLPYTLRCNEAPKYLQIKGNAVLLLQASQGSQPAPASQARLCSRLLQTRVLLDAAMKHRSVLQIKANVLLLLQASQGSQPTPTSQARL